MQYITATTRLLSSAFSGVRHLISKTRGEVSVATASKILSSSSGKPPSRTLIIVNLGTPEAPTAAAIRTFLAEFLHDWRIIQISRWLWCPLLHFIILPIRGAKVAKKYASIWLEGGSPLAVYTEQLAQRMQDNQESGVTSWNVLSAMRYGKTDSLRTLLRRLRASGVEEATVIPLYPQYSTTTTESVKDMLSWEKGSMQLNIANDYYRNDWWITAIADSIAQWRATHGAGDHLVMSYHSIPERLATKEGDPYPDQCTESTKAIAAKLGLGEGEYTMSYQSKFGREKWLQPPTDKTIELLSAKFKRVDVVCPGFAVDCLETLEEVNMMLREQFEKLGGELRYIPCLNDSKSHALALLQVAESISRK